MMDSNDKLSLNNILYEDNYLHSITKLCSLISFFPICFISIIDHDNQYLVSSNILKIRQLNKQFSFCNYTINQYNVYEIEDIIYDPLYKDNPLLEEEPNIRFYAGIPLTSPQGNNIGTLCILDTKPNKLNEIQRLLLKTYSIHIVNYFELNIKNKELETYKEINKRLIIEKDEFISNITHELRTPLNAIYGFTQVLSKTDLDETQKENLDIIRTSIEHLISLINNVLDITKIEADKIIIEDYTFDIKENMNYIHRLININGKNIKLNLQIDHELPNKLIGDKIRLNQILINLISNGIKYTDKGSVDCILNLYDETEEDVIIRFSVKDTGIGIPECKLKSLFNRYEQVHKNNFKNFGGTGLGLSIAKKLVEIQGGELFVKSSEGKGSEFYFSLKYKKHKHNIDKDNTELLKGIKILLFEDNQLNIKLIKRLTEKLGIELDISINGKIGIDNMNKQKYDLILMDINMPEMNGYEATEYIRKKLNLDIPIIAMTANNNEAERIKCSKYGMNEFITKPFKQEQFYNILMKYIKRNESKSKNSGEDKLIKVKTCIPPTRKKNSTDVFKLIHTIEKINFEEFHIYTGYDNELESDLIKIFLKETPNCIMLMEENIKKINYESVSNIAHKLKSSVKIFGLNKLSSYLSNLENLCKSNDFNRIEELFSKIKNKFQVNLDILYNISHD